MLAWPVEFKWVVHDDRVEFLAYEPYIHRHLCFLQNTVHIHKRTPTLSEWLDFFKENNVDRSVIKKKIEFFNRHKKNQARYQRDHERLFPSSMTSAPKKAKKVIIKKS